MRSFPGEKRGDATPGQRDDGRNGVRKGSTTPIRPPFPPSGRCDPCFTSCLPEHLPGYGNPLFKAGALEVLHNRFEHGRDVDMPGAFVHA